MDKKNFSAVFHAGRAFHSPSFVIKYSPSKASYARFGVSCGLRISKKATERNLLKRRIFEIIGVCAESMQSGDYVIIAKPAIQKQSFVSIRNELIQALQSITKTRKHFSH